MTRKRLGTLGERGNLVRYFEESKGGVKRYVVQWGPKGARQQESWPFTKEGKAEAESFFKAFGDEIKAKPAAAAPLSNRQLWDAYKAAEWEHLRPNTRRLYEDAWRKWEQHAGAESIAEETPITLIHDFRKKLDGLGLATATVQDAIRNVRIVFNWAERMELIARNRWHLFLYKVAKEKRTQPRPEYRGDEFVKIWGALDPTLRGQWRPWCLVGLLGIYGNRQNELLNLQWAWIAGNLVTIPAAYVKTGDEGTLTLFPLTRRILDVAREWAEKEGYRGPFVFFPGQSAAQRAAKGANPTTLPHYSIQSLTDAIHAAEERGGVERKKWRAGHGFRRGLVGDLIDETGDPTLALQAIRDRDPRMLQNYRVRRNDKVDTAVQQRAQRLMPEDVK